MIVGRKRELKLLERAFSSRKSEFITVYGRRRVGKTYLIREFFNDKKCHFFHATGIQGKGRHYQLEKFTEAFSEAFFHGAALDVPNNWRLALERLHRKIEVLEGNVVIFLDELPWLATQRSDLMVELDYYWNRYWVAMPNVILVVCGSSASWMIKKIINNKGGFHNRTTLTINLQPFNLSETRQYLRYNGFKLSNKHILSLYMAVGGIPYYLNLLHKNYTAQQNIQMLFFDENSVMRDEFNILFNSLFKSAEHYKEIIQVVSKRQDGLTQAEIGRMTKGSERGGTLSQRLYDLAASGFIQTLVTWGNNKQTFYKVSDEFCLFYLRWVEPHKGLIFESDYWIVHSKSQEYATWSGYAFEAVCRKHIHLILRALHIRGASPMASWRFTPGPLSNELGAQIDLVVDRQDDAITLIEMKYTRKPFILDKRYAEDLIRKKEVFKKKTQTDKDIFFAMVSANGIRKTIYSDELISAVATLEDLFNTT